MERLTNKKEADAQRKSYERRIKQGYPRNIPEERFLKLAAYEDAEEQGRLVVFPEPTPDIDFMRIFNLVMADAEDRVIVPPCKVGSTVYWIPDLSDKWEQEMWETKVKEQGRILTDIVFGFMVYEDHVRLILPNLGIEPIYPHKHLFFTREEAEAALIRAKEGVSN